MQDTCYNNINLITVWQCKQRVICAKRSIVLTSFMELGLMAFFRIEIQLWLFCCCCCCCCFLGVLLKSNNVNKFNYWKKLNKNKMLYMFSFLLVINDGNGCAAHLHSSRIKIWLICKSWICWFLNLLTCQSTVHSFGKNNSLWKKIYLLKFESEKCNCTNTSQIM